MPQKKQLYFLVILISFFSCVSILTPNDIITKSLETIEEIDYIEYSSITTLSAHRDTSNFYRTIRSSWKVKINPEDSVIGAQYYQIYDDSSVGKGSECYDGDYRVLNTFINELSTIIDSNLNPEKIKSLIAPFHIRAKAILEYALKDDSCQINVLAESKGEVTVKIEFIRKNILSFSMKVEHGRGDGGNSVYEITFSKDTNLPTRIIYKSSYQVIEWDIGNIKVNPSERENIIAMNTIPNGYRITDNPKTSNDIDLTGKQAPDFKLVNSNGVSIKLSDYQGKTILLEFTSMGCAPCQLAIPDLIKLKNEYSDLPFELISIESWVDRFSPNALKKHAIEKGINYETTYGSKAISEKFHVYGVPTFFIIDKNGIIKKRFVGYIKDSTKMKLGNILKELL